MTKITTKLKDNHGVMVLLMKLPKLSINNKEDSNSYAPALSSKKDIPQATSAQPACLWYPNNDGSVTVKYENDKMHCFVCLFGLAP